MTKNVGVGGALLRAADREVTRNTLVSYCRLENGQPKSRHKTATLAIHYLLNPSIISSNIRLGCFVTYIKYIVS